MVDVLGSVLFVAAGQAVSWAFLPKFSWPMKVGAGILASLTVPALLSAALNWVGVPFNAVMVYLVFLALLVLGVFVLWKQKK